MIKAKLAQLNWDGGSNIIVEFCVGYC